KKLILTSLLLALANTIHAEADELIQIKNGTLRNIDGGTLYYEYPCKPDRINGISRSSISSIPIQKFCKLTKIELEADYRYAEFYFDEGCDNPCDLLVYEIDPDTIVIRPLESLGPGRCTP
ncbi:MAG TPA: hypothetical protein VFF04_00390, partial [Candidatus Babeliales bacterium]|nr:hypothetical protein [Candidatus Babeliales bacterium]